MECRLLQLVFWLRIIPQISARQHLEPFVLTKEAVIPLTSPICIEIYFFMPLLMTWVLSKFSLVQAVLQPTASKHMHLKV